MGEFDTLVGLVSEYSPSGQEHSAVEWLVARMKALDYDDAFIDDAGNTVGVMGKGGKQIVLLGHIDTVPGEIKVEKCENLLYGRATLKEYANQGFCDLCQGVAESLRHRGTKCAVCKP